MCTVFPKHQESSKGDMLFIEMMLPDGYEVKHIDSYNTNGKKRFQGCFYFKFKSKSDPDNPTISTNCDCPLAILKFASRYQIHICIQCGNPHIVWTIWFD